MKTIILLATIALLASCSTPKKELDNVFYPFNNSMTSLPNAPESLAEQMQLVKDLGYTGFGGHIRDDYFKRREAMDKVGLPMPELYWGIDLDSAGVASYHPKIKEIIKDSKDRNLVVTLFFTSESYMNNREEGDLLFADVLREIADYAAGYNVKVAAYPHVNLYVEEIGHAVRLAQMVNRENFGVAFNTCHFLIKEGDANWKEKLTDALPYLFMVSIAGADDGDTRKMHMDRLIQPLGEGTYDIYKFVEFLKDNNYNGPFGLQCYGIKQDCEVVLTKSMKTWNEYKERYAEYAH